MRVAISARHTHLSEKLKAYAQEKVGKLERFDESVAQAELVLNREFHRPQRAQRPDDTAEPLPSESSVTSVARHAVVGGDVGAAELIVSVAREHTRFVAHADGESLYAAIDLVVDKMERQLRRYKEKLKGRHR